MRAMRAFFAVALMLFCHLAWAQKTGSTTITVHAASGGPCPVTVGTLALRATPSRVNGISPLAVWIDATATTDSSLTVNQTVTQDVTFSMDYGDTNPSGTGKWLYGANPNQNSRNTSTGIVGAHMYQTAGADTAPTVTVTAQNQAGTVASCTVALSVFDPNGANGFTTKICQSTSGNFAGCPASATHSTSPSMSANVNTAMNSKEVLFRCTETFTGGASINGTKGSVGAYGGCEGTSTNRPIMTGSIVTPGAANDSANLVDMRLADLDFESSGTAVNTGFPVSGAISNQVTLYNLKSTGNNTSFYIQQTSQVALVQLFQSGMGTQQGTYIQVGQNNCSNLVLNTYPCATGVFVPINYVAVLGSHFDGTGSSGGGGVETVRVSACRFCSFTNSDYLNANTVGAVLKFHNGNTFNTQCIWTGQWTEQLEISDNFFGGQSGGQLVELTPQNAVTDERIRLAVIERNVFHQVVGTNDALSLSAMNATVRDNAYNKTSDGVTGVKLGNRGVSGTSDTYSSVPSTCDPAAAKTTAPTIPLYPQFDEVYNNTCDGSGTCFAFSASGEFTAGGPANNSIAQNNLVFGGSVSSNSGSGNTILNNTSTTANNPGFTNASGTLNVITDFKPTANFTGGVNVPVVFDALGTAWSPTWDWGAVHH